MLTHYVKAGLRILSGQRFYALINVIGLAVGLASFIFIALFIRYETSFESGFTQADRIYRISRDYYQSAERSAAKPAGMPAPAAALLKQDFPQVEQAARIFCCGAVVKTEAREAVLEGGYAMGDSELFEIFDFDWISGDPQTALAEPYTVVLTRSAAERHFGNADPMGQVIQYGGGQNWQSARVTGVIEDLPDNTHLRFDFLESNTVWTDCRCDEQEGSAAYYNSWENNVFYTYVLLAAGANIEGLQRQSGAFFERHVADGASRETGFTATPIRDIHLRSDRDGELWLNEDPAPAAGIGTLYSFGAVAVFILLLACVNYMNLATALSARRAKEVGVRKVAGATRGQLFAQFMLESGALVVVAAMMALAVVEFLLPAFGRFLVRTLVIDYVDDLNLLLFLAVLVMLTAVIAGSYPALYLSMLKPEAALRKQVAARRGTPRLRKMLVVFQFAVSIALLVCTLVVQSQMAHVRTRDPGFTRDGLLVLSPNNVDGEEWRTLKQQWLAQPGIEAVTSSRLAPFQDIPFTAAISASASDGVGSRMQFLPVDYGFFETYDIELLAGRSFSENFGRDRFVPGENGAPDTQPFILSASAARLLGWTPDTALGRQLEFSDIQGTRFQVDAATGPVIGVAPDIHFESLHSVMEPLVYTLDGSAQQTVGIRLRGADAAASIAAIRTTWRSFRPDVPANIALLEQRFAATYLREERQAQILTVFTVIALSIASLGLLGLAAQAAESRTKEIGVRKVMGGGPGSIVLLLTTGISKLVLLANLFAWPVAYFAMDRWLENFAYRINLTPVIFIGSGLIALCIAWVTVGGIAAKAASAKPVLALRYE